MLRYGLFGSGSVGNGKVGLGMDFFNNHEGSK